MKKKVFFLLSSLGIGGSEKVLWLLAQGFDKTKYEVSIVILNSTNDILPKDLVGVRIIDLKTINASRSFFSLLKLIRKERPYAVYATAMHINILIALVSVFVNIPRLIGRQSNIYSQITQFNGFSTRFWGIFVNICYRRFDKIVCQSIEMKTSFMNQFTIPESKLIIIANPVLMADTVKCEAAPGNKLIIVARLSAEKGHARLLNMLYEMPEGFTLTIAGDGELRKDIQKLITALGLDSKVTMLGTITNVSEVIAQHNLSVLASYTEGFPNVVLESLAVGVPVVAFRVGGISEIIKQGYNGFIAEQGDTKSFKSYVKLACSSIWDAFALRNDVSARFSISNICKQYESLID